MLTDIRSYARQSRYLLRKWASDPAVHKGVRITQCLLTGFLLSAAGLGQYMQPLVMGPVLAADPWCAVLTALGVFDRIAYYAGAGTIVPITGFANSIVSPAMEFHSEGFVLGTAANMFRIAGPVLVFGSAAAVIYGIIYYIFLR
jgi:stage V sporulation protein AC